MSRTRWILYKPFVKSKYIQALLKMMFKWENHAIKRSEECRAKTTVLKIKWSI